MKQNHKPTPSAPDWTRAKALLCDLKNAARRSLSLQVLLGKELSSIKKRLGIRHGNNQHGEDGQSLPILIATDGQLFPSVKTWETVCETELDISKRTADHYIKIFASALERVKARKNRAKREDKADALEKWEAVLRLLEIPAVELTGDEAEELAASVGELVDGNSQADLLYELGIVKMPHVLQGGDTSEFRKSPLVIDAAVMGTIFFGSHLRELAKLQSETHNLRYSKDFEGYMCVMPLAHPDTEVLGLVDYHAQLEDFQERLAKDLSDLIAKVRGVIEAKMEGDAPKRIRNKPTNARK